MPTPICVQDDPADMPTPSTASPADGLVAYEKTVAKRPRELVVSPDSAPHDPEAQTVSIKKRRETRWAPVSPVQPVLDTSSAQLRQIEEVLGISLSQRQFLTIAQLAKESDVCRTLPNLHIADKPARSQLPQPPYNSP